MADTIHELRDMPLLPARLRGLGAGGYVRAIVAQSRGTIQPPKGDAAGPTVQAEINHGRWLVKCPWCAGAEPVDKDDLFFYCLNCLNAAVGGGRVPVAMPQRTAALEALLVKRPSDENRNWLPGQALAEIAAENAAENLEATV